MNIRIKNSLLLAILLSVTGCVSVTKDISPAQSYRAKGVDELWRITGYLDSKFREGLVQTSVSRMINVFINGSLVIRGGLSADGSGELNGQYQGHEIASYCSSELKTATWLDIRCMILVDNERAATLTF